VDVQFPRLLFRVGSGFRVNKRAHGEGALPVAEVKRLTDLLILLTLGKHACDEPLPSKLPQRGVDDSLRRLSGSVRDHDNGLGIRFSHHSNGL